ncbi:MAG: hypothetical protein DHS20C11_21860 [Lysobacteraceae bacterium]|nr:MAG: hypothetical protein DHS20C11_21860 [Xanthomonadaceae bacterium]
METTMNTATDPATIRRHYFKVLLAIAIGMSLALGIVRFFTYVNNASADTFLGRVLESRDALPRIIEQPEDLVLFYGSSMVQAGFSPRQFDAAMAERGAQTKSFNFGFGGLNPLFQEIYARRIREAFEDNDRRLKLALIEFNPFQTTKTRRNRARSAEDSFTAILASPGELMQAVIDDPERGLRMLNIRYLRDGVSAEMITSFFGEPFQARRLRSELPRDEEADARAQELGEELGKRFEAEYPDYQGENWRWQWQGGGTIPEERPADTLALFEEYYEVTVTDYSQDNDRLSRIHTADIINLDFDPELVEAFIGIVENFKAISDNVEVVLLPKNTDWIQNPPEALDRMYAVMERIEQETGVRVRDFQEIEPVKNSYFSDTTHLNRYQGAVAFTQFLVDQYAGLID